MDKLTLDWRHIEWIAKLEGKSLIEIDVLRDKFFNEAENEKKNTKIKKNQKDT